MTFLFVMLFVPFLIKGASSTLLESEDLQYACELITDFGYDIDTVVNSVLNRVEKNGLARSKTQEKVGKAHISKLLEAIMPKTRRKALIFEQSPATANRVLAPSAATNFLCTVDLPTSLLGSLARFPLLPDLNFTCAKDLIVDELLLDRFYYMEANICKQLRFPSQVNISDVFDTRRLIIDTMIEKRQQIIDFLVREQIGNIQKWNKAWRQCPLDEILLMTEFSMRKDDIGFGCKEFFRSKSLSSTYEALKEKLSYRNIPERIFEKFFRNFDTLFRSLVQPAISHQSTHQSRDMFHSIDTMTCNQTSLLEMAIDLGDSSYSSLKNNSFIKARINVEKLKFSDFSESMDYNCGGVEFPTALNIFNPFQVKDVLFQSAVRREENIIRFLRQEGSRFHSSRDTSGQANTSPSSLS